MNDSKIILFGVNGQDGYYLRKKLEKEGYHVIGVSRSPGSWIRGDIGDNSFVNNLIKHYKPESIFHLAAHSKTDHELLWEHQHTILNGSLNVLESVLQYSPHTKVFITGSGLQFENHGNPIDEFTPFNACNAYALARIQSVYAARYYRNKGIKVYVGYLFHHDSPIRRENHLNRQIVEAAKAASLGKNVQLVIGDVSVEKEFGFAGDIIEGILALVRQEIFFEACIGTGQAFSIRKWLELCFGFYQKNWTDYIHINPHYKAPFKRLVSNPSLIHSIGWKHNTTIEKLAEMMIHQSEKS
ncbi:MAG: GDP-mannose 4,6-dehydratase [Chitinophagaceae bacterium]|nr:GDP-mannose 4,6-dehydratase [Chitinophagaceae bacterium]